MLPGLVLPSVAYFSSGIRVVRLGRKHVAAGLITSTLHKNRNRSPGTSVLPIPPELREVIDATELGPATFLITDLGSHSPAPRASATRCGIGAIKLACRSAPLTNGATAHQLKAIFGWITLKQPEFYTKAAEQKQLAGCAMGLLVTREKRWRLEPA